MSILKKIRTFLQKVVNVLERVKNTLPDPTNPIDEIISKNQNNYFTKYKDALEDLDGRKQFLNPSLTNIVYIYEKPDYSTFRYRGYNVAQQINSNLQSQYAASYFFMNELDTIIDLVPMLSLVVFIRTPYTRKLEEFILMLKKAQIKTYYDVDDIVFDPDRAEELIAIDNYHNNPEHENIIYGYIYRRDRIAQLCDSFLTTNLFLKKMIEKKYNKKCAVLPNFLNNEQLGFAKGLVKKELSTFTIGYFSGSSTHNNDFELIADTLFELMSSHKQIKLMVAGYLHLPERFAKFKFLRRVYQVPFVNFVEQLKLINTCNLNLIPLVESDFTNSKSELKFFEAGLVRTPSVASPTYIYKEVIAHGVNGMLASTQTDWKTCIEELIADKNLYGSISHNAQTYALENYSGQKITEQIRAFLEEALTSAN